MFFTKLRNLFIDQSTLEGVKGVADILEPAEKKPPIFIPFEEAMPDEELVIADIFTSVANEMSIDPNLMRAFYQVEAGNKHMVENRIIIRWESHYFKRFTGINIKVHGKRGRINVECQDREWEAFMRAATLLEGGKYREEAIKSSSWGAPQIMGSHFKRLGFLSPSGFRDYIDDSADHGIRMMGKFISTDKRLLKACRSFNYHLIATYYNGKHYKKYAHNGVAYDELIKKAYEKISSVSLAA